MDRPAKRVRNVSSMTAGGKVIRIGAAERLPEQIAEVYEHVTALGAQVQELEVLVLEMREQMGLERVPDWRQHAP